MKANEAPEKIYISVVPSEFGGNKTITCGKDFPNAVEYILTDAFIEKACFYIKNMVLDITYSYVYGEESYNIDEFIEDFEEYLKK